MKRSLALFSIFFALILTPPAFAQDGDEQSEGTGVESTDKFPTAPDAEGAKRYSVRELVEISERNAPVMREHAAKINKAEWQQYRADWAWGPKLKTQFILAPVPEKAELDEFASNLEQYLSLNIGPLFRSKAEIAIPLYTFDRISIAQDLAALGVNVEKLKREEARYDLAFQVKRAYYSVQLANAFNTLLGSGNSLIKEKLADMEDARDFGEADFSTEDFRKLQIFNAEFDGRVLDNRKLHDIAVEGVGYFTGIEGFRVDGLKDEGQPAPILPFETYLDAAKVRRPDWRMLEAAVRARGLQVEMAKSEFYPNIGFGATFGFGFSTESIDFEKVCRRPTPDDECIDTTDLYARPYSDPFNFLSVNFALLMSWNFDFWQLRGKFGEAKAEEQAVLAQRERAVGAIELEIRKLYLDASQAYQKVKVQERRLDAARRWRDQFGLSVETAGTDIEKGIDPLKAYFEAKALQLQARYEYEVARAALAKGIGARWLGDVEPELPVADSAAKK